jgi:hypothetical protein
MKFVRPASNCIALLFVVVAVVAVLVYSGAASKALAQSQTGFTYNGMAYASYWYNEYQYTPQGPAGTAAMAAAGVDYATVLVTQYVTGPTDTTIAPETTSSPGYPGYPTTPTDDAVVAAITNLQAQGIKVALKPHVDSLEGTWRGEFAPPSSDTPAEATAWADAWFASYQTFVLHYAAIAAANNVDTFVIGCELRDLSGSAYESYWDNIIAQIRTSYPSLTLTYASNATSAGDEFTSVSFWDKLDMIGVDGYFPLTNHSDPTLSELKNAWTNAADNKNGFNPQQALENLQSAHSTPLIFTELGYMSTSGTNEEPYNYSHAGSYDPTEQQNCYEAFFEVFSQQTSWMKGVFWWDWSVSPPATDDLGYSPQNKPAGDVTLPLWYGSSAPNFRITPVSSAITLVQGLSSNDTVVVTELGGMTGGVTLSASGLPSGVTAGFGTNPTTGASVITLTATTTAATGTATVTINGVSGSLTGSATIALTVNAPPSITLSALPASLTVTQGSSATSTITVTVPSGFVGVITLGASNLPSGVTAAFGEIPTFAPNTPTSVTSLLTLTASSTATVGGPVMVTVGILTCSTCVYNPLYVITEGGQSLATGSMGIPALSTTQPYNNVMLSPGVSYSAPPLIPLVEGTLGYDGTNYVETTSSGMANYLAAANGGLHFGVGLHGNDGSAYAQIAPGTSPYLRGVAQLQAFKSATSANNRTFIPLGEVLTHGETDYVNLNATYISDSNPHTVYEADLEAYQAALLASVQTISPTTSTYPLILSQMSSGRTGDMAQAQWQACTDNPTTIYCATSKYFLTAAARSNIHLNNISDKILGEYYAKAIQSIMTNGGWTPLQMTDTTLSGDVVTVNFSIPALPLALDTTTVWPHANYGFEYTDASGGQTIDSVGLAGTPPQRVTVSLSGAPGKNAWLGYALTCPAGGIDYCMSGNHAIASDANFVGGNIRDSDCAVSPSITGSGFPLCNWLISGKIPIPSAPAAPTVSATSSGLCNTCANVTFSTFNTSGYPITSVTATSNPGSIQVSGTTSPLSFTTLTTNQPYTFNVTETNAYGIGTAATTNSVTPVTVTLPAAAPIRTSRGMNNNTSGNGHTATAAVAQTASYSMDGSVTLSSPYNCGLPCNLTPATPATIALIVNAAPGFALNSPLPPALTVIPGAGNAGAYITINDLNGFTGAVTLAATGLPSGVTAAWTTNPATTNSTLLLTASSTAPLGGPFTVTITGTSGALTASTTIAVIVNGPQGIKLSASPASLTVVQGSSGISTINVTLAGGVTNPVTLTASGLPSGVTASSCSTPYGASVLPGIDQIVSCQLTFTAAGTATVGGPVTVTINGIALPEGPVTCGIPCELTASTTIALTVAVPPSFTLAPSAPTLAVTQGSSATDTITVTDVGGFTGAVTLAASGLPTGVTAAFGANPASGFSVLTLTANGTATVGGPVTVTVTGASVSMCGLVCGLTASTTFALTVNAAPVPSFALSASPASLNVTAGDSGTSTITVTPSGGFTGSVTLTAAITASPANAENPPTWSFGTIPVSITGVSAGTAALTLSTTAASGGCTASDPMQREVPWSMGGGAALACILLFGIPARRRRWRKMLGVLALLVALACGMTACGGSVSKVCGTAFRPATTSGAYTITVTASSGAITAATATVTLNVQ